MTPRSALQRRVERALLAFARDRRVPLHVVGGAIRDALLERDRAVANLDLAIPSDALATGRRLAAALGGTYIGLDEATGSARVVVIAGDERVEVDLSDYRGPTLSDDLARRDFTINAMAVPLAAWCEDPRWAEQIVDPLGGRRDLAAKRLRACFPQTFLDDPLRMLRAVRFAVTLDVELDPSLPPMIAEHASRLASVSGERIRDECFAILQTSRAGWACALLNQLGVLDVLFPELRAGRGIEQGGYHHLDVLGHELETLVQFDRMLLDFAEFSPELRAPMAAYCDVMPVEGRTRKALMKLSGLYHDVGKPATRRVKEDGDIWFIGHEQFGATLIEAMAERLKLSNREAEMVERMVLYHLRPGHLSRTPELTPRAIFRFFRDLGDDGPACLLVWWADRLSTRGPSSKLDQIDQQRARLEELLRAYFLKPEESVRPPKLLDGNELMQALGLPSGPQIGRLLQAIQEAQAEGRVRSRSEAIELAKASLGPANGQS